MTGRDEEVPFTVSVDFDLTPRPGVALRAHGADVSIRRATVPDSLPCADARGPAWEHAGGRVLIRHPGGARSSPCTTPSTGSAKLSPSSGAGASSSGCRRSRPGTCGCRSSIGRGRSSGSGRAWRTWLLRSPRRPSGRRERQGTISHYRRFRQADGARHDESDGAIQDVSGTRTCCIRVRGPQS